MYLTQDEEHSAPDDTLGGRIVYAREQQDLTTAQLARRVGVKTDTMQGWESDRSEPRSNRLLTLAGMLNVSPTPTMAAASADRPTTSHTRRRANAIERVTWFSGRVCLQSSGYWHHGALRGPVYTLDRPWMKAGGACK